MKKMMIVLAMMAASASSAFAAGKSVIAVKGMVCGFCAQGIEKKFGAEAAVEKVKVSLEKKARVSHVKRRSGHQRREGGKILIDSGFNVEKVERK